MPPRPRLTGRVRATDRWSNGGAPAVRAPAEGQYHGEHLALSPVVTKCERAYKSRPFLLPRAPPPSHPAIVAAAGAPPPPAVPLQPKLLAPSLGST
jgi:hypothetical protein